MHAIIGDLIWVPEEEVEKMGGFDTPIEGNSINDLRKRLLAPDFTVTRAPVEIAGDISYVEQQAWIMNKTIRENILFGKPLDHARYV